MRLKFFIILIFSSFNLSAQKKLSFELSGSVLQSVGKDISTVYNSHVNPIFSVYYLSRSRFKHPYFNILGHVAYSISSKIDVGLQTGAYIHYLEKYFSPVERTTLSIPVMATFNYKLIDINSKPFGIELAAGKIFYNIDGFPFKVKNGSLYNLSAFYTFTKKSAIKLGVEKQVDNVSVYLISDIPEYPNETYKYHLNRLSLMLSYSFRFGK